MSPLRIVLLGGRDHILMQEMGLPLRHPSPVDRIPLLYLRDDVHGFVTDFGTIPPPAWPIIGHPLKKRARVYAKHDYLWSFRDQAGLSFRQTNDELYADCLDAGDTAAAAFAIYAAVRAFGKRIWDRGAKRVGDLDFHYARIPEVVL